jgi:predicted lysophospholipase L1 biosynthesis ABC-type transport system permease subunit
MASGGVAAGVFLAAVVFGTSLAAVVSTPAAYGWQWDVAMMGGFGYGPIDVEQVTRDLTGRDDVASWTALGFTQDVTIDDDPVLSMVGLDRSSTVDLPVVAGRLPTAAGEVALGSRTAADHDVGVGDRIEVGGETFGPQEVVVTGLVVLPPLGPFVSDRASPGVGMLMPEAMAPPVFLAESIAFVGIDLVDGTDPRRVATEMHDVFAGWDANGWAIVDYDRPVRPAEIVDADRMRTLPLLAGALVVAAAVLGLALTVVLSVRSRRRELAVLRALGFTGRQLRDSVRVQALATMVVALGVGLPVGIALGRLAWRAFADQLGVAAGPVVPLGWIGATIAGGLAVALVAAALPARTAARVDPAVVLRSE